MTTLTDTETYRCSDLNLSAFLMLNACSVLKTEREGSRVIFHFIEVSKAEKLARDFFNKKSKVLPLDYASALRQAKDICFAELRR